jgi:hypothetical protein
MPSRGKWRFASGNAQWTIWEFIELIAIKRKIKLLIGVSVL